MQKADGKLNGSLSGRVWDSREVGVSLLLSAGPAPIVQAMLLVLQQWSRGPATFVQDAATVAQITRDRNITVIPILGQRSGFFGSISCIRHSMSRAARRALLPAIDQDEAMMP